MKIHTTLVYRERYNTITTDICDSWWTKLANKGQTYRWTSGSDRTCLSQLFRWKPSAGLNYLPRTSLDSHMISLNQKSGEPAREKNIYLLAFHTHALCSKRDRETWRGCHLTTNPSGNIRRVCFVPLGDALRLISFFKGWLIETVFGCFLFLFCFYILFIKKTFIKAKEKTIQNTVLTYQ